MPKKQYDEEFLLELNQAAHELLVGKVIVSTQVKPIADRYDDIPHMELIFSDGTTVAITSYYGGYSGSSEDEYSTFIGIRSGLVDA